MRDSMHVCGKILTTANYHFFALSCEKCDASFGQWSGFLKHLRKNHDLVLPVKTEDEDEKSKDLEIEEAIKASVKDEIEFELNKQFKVDVDDAPEAAPSNNDSSDEDYSQSEPEFSAGATKESEPRRNANDDKRDAPSISSKKSEVSSVDEWTMDNNNQMDDDSDSDDEEWKLDEKKKPKQFNFNIHDAKTRDISCKFLKILQKYPILWDQQHSSYWMPEKRTRVLYTIRQYITRLGYAVTDYGIRSALQRIVRDHKAAKQELAVCGHLDEKKTLLLKKCKFLDGEKQEEGNEENNDSGTDDDGQIPDDFYDEDFSMSSDAESTTANNPETINAFVKDSRDGKRICFNLLANPLVDEFVALLRENTSLWEAGQFQNYTERRRIIETWIPIFQERHNVTFVYRDLALNLKLLRRALYNMDDRKVLNKSAQRLKDICSFLPRAKPCIRLKCDLCNRNFLTDYTLAAHKYAAHNIGENPFKCEVCGRDFQAHSQLDTHLRRVHLKQFNIHCDVCNRGFLQHSAMMLHRQTHTGEKTFVCETCGKAFRRKINMQQHTIRIHLRQRNFPCELCPKTFYMKCHLRDHMNAHLNIRNHKCPFCGKAFHSSHALMRHKQIHSEVKRYACKLCDARFHQFVGLNSHMKNKHKFVNDKDDEVQPQPIVHMTTLPATTTATTTAPEDNQMQIKGELVQSLDSWNM